MTTHQKLRGFISILFFFLFFSQAFTQSRYNDYSTSEKAYIYQEDFSASSTSWEDYESGRRSTKIESGQLMFSSLNDKTQVKYRIVSHDWEADWEIEMAVKWVTGKENSAIDLIWDKESGNSHKYHFGFTAGKKYVLAEYKNDGFEHILKFIPSSLVNRSAKNIMTVRKVGQTYYFFVNRTLIKSIPYKKVKGDFVGFTVPPNSSIAVDYLYVSQLKKNTTNNRIVNSTVSAGTYNAYSSSDLTNIYRENFSEQNSKWEVYSSGQRMGKIHNGVLDWISMNNRAQVVWHTMDKMDWSRDWQIEARVKFVTGKENSSNDLVWNIADDGGDKYHFGFTGEGKYVFSKKVGSEYQKIVPFTSSSMVNKGAFNKMTVRKTGNTYNYFFNEQLITTKSYHTVSSNRIGFMVAPNTTIQIDYLDVSYLKPKSSTLTSSRLPSGENFVGIMTKYNGYNLQRWKTRDAFPKDAIQSDWDDGYQVSDLSYDDNKWSLVMSKGTGYSTQTWITRNDWPKDDIKEKWNENYRITEANYGNGVWAIVFSKGSSLGRQRWSTRSDFPSEKIKEFADEGLWITEIAYGKDRWALVGSKDTNIRGQKWFKTAEFPESQIKQYQGMGYAVTQLSRENDWWVLVMTKFSNNRPQELITSKVFPKDEIRKYWDQGYYLTDLSYGNLSQANTQPSTRLIKKSSNEKINDLIIGRWYGGAPDETERGYFTFDKEFASITQNGETTGGKGYEVDGVFLDLKYEIDNSFSPPRLDLVFYYEKTDFGRLKGLINMIDDDTFEVTIADELTNPRPTSLASSSGNKIAVYKRVKN